MSEQHVFSPLNEMASLIYNLAKRKGWHEGAGHPTIDREYFKGAIANLHAEISELWEAFRNNKLDSPCDKEHEMMIAGIQPLTCKEEELADIIIRALDLSKRLGVNIAEAVSRKHQFNAIRPYRHGGKKA